MGTVNRLLLYHRHYRRRQDYMAPHRFGHQVRSRLRWPRVFGTNSGHTLKPSRLYGRCTSSRIRVSLPTDVLWLFSQQHRFFYTTPNKVYYSLWMHTFRRSAAEFGVIRSINKKYTHGHAQILFQPIPSSVLYKKHRERAGHTRGTFTFHGTPCTPSRRCQCLTSACAEPNHTPAYRPAQPVHTNKYHPIV